MFPWSAKDGKPEIDFETDVTDFRLPSIQIEELKKGLRISGSLRAEQNIPDMHYSLRVSTSLQQMDDRDIICDGMKFVTVDFSADICCLSICTEEDMSTLTCSALVLLIKTAPSSCFLH